MTPGRNTSDELLDALLAVAQEELEPSTLNAMACALAHVEHFLDRQLDRQLDKQLDRQLSRKASGRMLLHR